MSLPNGNEQRFENRPSQRAAEYVTRRRRPMIACVRWWIARNFVGDYMQKRKLFSLSFSFRDLGYRPALPTYGSHNDIDNDVDYATKKRQPAQRTHPMRAGWRPAADYTHRAMDRFSREVVWQMEVATARESSQGPPTARCNIIGNDRRQRK